MEFMRWAVPFFPFVFTSLPVSIMRPAPRWDDETAGEWTDGDPEGDELAPLDDGEEEYAPD
jgi:hypothetical protein